MKASVLALLLSGAAAIPTTQIASGARNTFQGIDLSNKQVVDDTLNKLEMAMKAAIMNDKKMVTRDQSAQQGLIDDLLKTLLGGGLGKTVGGITGGLTGGGAGGKGGLGGTLSGVTDAVDGVTGGLTGKGGKGGLGGTLEGVTDTVGGLTGGLTGGAKGAAGKATGSGDAKRDLKDEATDVLKGVAKDHMAREEMTVDASGRIIARQDLGALGGAGAAASGGLTLGSILTAAEKVIGALGDKVPELKKETKAVTDALEDLQDAAGKLDPKDIAQKTSETAN